MLPLLILYIIHCLFLQFHPLRVKEEDDMLLMVGGIIPTADMPALKAIGVKGIFGPGTLDEDVVNFIKENIRVQAQSA